MKNYCWDGNEKRGFAKKKPIVLFSMQLFVITILLFVTSCSTIVYRSKGRIPISFNKSNNHRREIILRGKKDFYLWGLIPNRHYVYIDEIARDSGLKELSRVEIYGIKTIKDSIFTILSFGLYVPSSYQIEAMTLKN